MSPTTVVQTQRDLHVRRKVFHFLSVMGIFSCMVLLSPKTNWTLYLVVGIPLVLLDLGRLRVKSVNRWLVERMGPLLRKRELRGLTGGAYAILGIGLVYLSFPSPVSQLAVLFLAIGDPGASYFGLRFGKRKVFGDKSWAGFFAAFLLCTFASLAFLSLQSREFLHWSWAPVLGLCGALAELTPTGVDDNLSQPLISASLISLLFLLINGSPL